MSIQIGRGSIQSLINTTERLVLTSPNSNLIQLYSTSSNVFIDYEGIGGPFQTGLATNGQIQSQSFPLLANQQSSNGAYVITQQSAVIASFTSNVVVYTPDTYFNNAFIVNGCVSNVIIIGNSNIDPVFTITGGDSTQANLVTVMAGTRNVGIGISNPTDSLHVIDNVRANASLISSNVITSVLTPTYTTNSQPLIVNGHFHVLGNFILDGQQINSSSNLVQFAQLDIQDLLTVSRIDVYPKTTADKCLTLLQNQTYTSFLSNVMEVNIQTGPLVVPAAYPTATTFPTFFIDPIGQVGIGTNVPAAVLHCSLNGLTSNLSSNLLRIDGSIVNNRGSNVPSSIVVSPNLNIGIGTLSPSNVIHIVGNYGLNGLLYATADTSNMLSVNNTAWVGIGTSSPTSKLHIVAAISSNVSILSSNLQPLINVQQYAANVNVNLAPYIAFTSNSTVVTSVDSLGHINIGATWNSSNTLIESSFCIRGDKNVRFPLVETNTVRAWNVPITIYTSNLSSNWNLTYTSNAVYNYSNWLSVSGITSNYTIYTSNYQYSNITTSNITYYGSGAITITNQGPLINLQPTLSTSNVSKTGFSNIVFFKYLGTSSNTTISISSNTYVVTSNAGFATSNISFEYSSLSNINNISCQGAISCQGFTGSTIAGTLITATNINVLSTLITKNIAINGLTVTNDIATISVDNSLFSGSNGMVIGGTSNDLITAPYTQGRLKVILNGSPQIASQISRGVTVYGDADCAMSINTSWLSGRPLIELNNSAISAQYAFTSTPFSPGLVGVGTDGNVFIGYENTTYPTISIQQYGTFSGQTGANGAIVLGKYMNISNNSGYVSISTATAQLFAASYPLHIRGDFAVDNNNSSLGYPMAIYVDSTNSRVNIGTATKSTYTLNVAGTQYVSSTALFGSNVTVQGFIQATNSIFTTSDRSLKTDLVKIKNALDKVDSLTGYTYTRLDTLQKETGLIAQDVERILPEAVDQRSETLSIAYGNLMGLVVEAIKELRMDVNKLSDRIDSLGQRSI